MTNQTVKTLGLTIAVAVPSTVEEYDQMAKESGAALKSAVLNTIYRSYLAAFRAEFVEKIQALTGIERKTKPSGKFEKGEDGKEDPSKPILVFDETEAEYFDRVQAQTGKTADAFQSVADELVSAVDEEGKLVLAFDPSATEKKPAGPKQVAKTYLEAAKTLVDQGIGEAVASKLAAKLGITVEVTVESIGRAIAENERRSKAELVARLAAM